MTYTFHKQAKHAHNDEYMYKNETNRVRYQPLTTPQVVLIFIIALHLCDLNNNMKPNSTEDGLTLQRTHKTKEEQQIFLVFSIFKTSKQSKNKQSKIFLDFSLRQSKAKNKRNK